jgi:hypothetical protein
MMHARRGEERLQKIAIAEPDTDRSADSRTPCGALVRRFIDACELGGRPSPGLPRLSRNG